MARGEHEGRLAAIIPASVRQNTGFDQQFDRVRAIIFDGIDQRSRSGGDPSLSEELGREPDELMALLAAGVIA